MCVWATYTGGCRRCALLRLPPPPPPPRPSCGSRFCVATDRMSCAGCRSIDLFLILSLDADGIIPLKKENSNPFVC